MRTVTPIQLYILTVFTLFSGFFTGTSGGIAAAGAKTLLFLLFATLASHGTKTKKTGYSAFLRSYAAGAERGFAGAFLVLSGVAIGGTAVFFADSAYMLCPFLPWRVLFLAVVGAGIALANGGVRTVARTAEVCLFLLIPLIIVRPFGVFSAGGLVGGEGGMTGALAVLADLSYAAAFYLAAVCVTSNDAGVSDAFAASGKKPHDRSSFIFRVMAAGAGTAFLLYLVFSLFSFGGGDVFFKVLLWMLLFLRLGLFTSFFAEGLRCVFLPQRE